MNTVEEEQMKNHGGDPNLQGRCIKKLSSGKYVDLANFTEADVDINDITTSLDLMRRFNGHYNRLPSLVVTAHSLLVHDLARDAGHSPLVRIFALIHDFPEAYYGDIQTGIKYLMGDAYKSFTLPIDDAVESVVTNGLTFSEDVRRIVKKYDTMSLDIERASMWMEGDDNPDNWPDITYNGSVDEKREIFNRYTNLVQPGLKIENQLKTLLEETP